MTCSPCEISVATFKVNGNQHKATSCASYLDKKIFFFRSVMQDLITIERGKTTYRAIFLHIVIAKNLCKSNSRILECTF